MRRSEVNALVRSAARCFQAHVLATTVSGIDNDASPVEFARLGVMTVKTAAASGTVRLDQFESRRVNYIGPE